MNEFRILGRLVEAPTTKDTAPPGGHDSRVVTEAVVEVPPPSTDRKADFVPIEAWAKAGEALASLGAGTWVLVTGRAAGTTSVTEGGDEFHRARLKASMVVRVDGKTIPPPRQAQDQAAPQDEWGGGGGGGHHRGGHRGQGRGGYQRGRGYGR